jgi:hypothetical protein
VIAEAEDEVIRAHAGVPAAGYRLKRCATNCAFVERPRGHDQVVDATRGDRVA